MYGTGIVKGLWITLGHLLGKKITVQYPEEAPVLQKRFRGCLQFEFEKCIVCGMCEKSCPNHVLKLETITEEGAKKKKLLTYTIDLQYCMFCNLCVEVCPGNCLSFNHNFELAQYRREDLAIVYHRPAHLDVAPPVVEAETGAEAAPTAEDEEKQQKKIAAMVTALTKNPEKALTKVLDNEEQRAVMVTLLAEDPKKIEKLGELMAIDPDKAKKLALALVAKAARQAAPASEEDKA